MDTTALILWHSFLKGTPPPIETALTGCITPDLLEKLNDLPLAPIEKLESFVSPETTLDKIHYSWFASFLRSLPEREIKFFLSALTPKQVKGLKQSLLLSNSIPPLSPLGNSYLKKLYLRPSRQLTWFRSIASLPIH